MGHDPAVLQTFGFNRQALAEKYRNEHWESRCRDFALVEQLAANHTTISGFVEQYTIDPLHTSEVNSSGDKDVVTLITIHSAKGTEAKICNFPGVSPGAYPMTRSLHSIDEVEEERRVLYVAITRAQDELILTRCNRGTFTSSNVIGSSPSLHSNANAYFLTDLHSTLVDPEISRVAKFWKRFKLRCEAFPKSELI